MRFLHQNASNNEFLLQEDFYVDTINATFCIINYFYVSYEYVSNGAFAGYPGFLSCVNT